jgi:probable phosphoglycerate mutase
MSGQIILVRHGRTALNAQGRMQGRLDEPLDDVGVRQAEALGSHLSAELGPDDLIVSSPLQRARRTAEAIAKGRDVLVDERWIELAYGEFDGRLQSDIPTETWNRWRSDDTYAPPGGESLVEVATRVVAACEHWRREAIGRRVVIVSHVSPIKAAIVWALGADTSMSWRMRLDTAAVSRLAVAADTASLTSFNETHHL